MTQMLLGETGIVKPKTSEDRQLDFYKEQLVELEQWKKQIETDDWENKEWEQCQEVMMGEWWYCNHIVGWNNNVPADNLYSPCKYPDVPDNDCMASAIRNCFISVRRDKVRYDKAYALERVNKAIESYKVRICN